MFEKKGQAIIPFPQFLLRVFFCFCVGVFFISLAISIGIIGFHHFENMQWLNAFENSAMILSTMGPVDEIKTSNGKIFSAFYALFSGLMFVTIMGVIFAPIIHRCLHQFHTRYDK